MARAVYIDVLFNIATTPESETYVPGYARAKQNQALG